MSKEIKQAADIGSGARFLRTGASGKARDAKAAQTEIINKQRQKEQRTLAERTSELATRRALPKSKGAGRSLLTATSPAGSSTLGG